MSHNRSISSNFFWRLLERFGAQTVTLVVSIVLARILDPTTYGAVAVIIVFTSFCNIFIDGGFSAALVQKKDADDIDFSSVFYFNLAVCVLLYIVLFIVAPFISDFYNISVLKWALRIQALTLIVSGFKGIQVTYVTKTMQFKKFFFSTLGGTITAAVVGIWMALKGFGIWALVVQGLVNNVVDTIILWITVKWKPMLAFSFSRIKRLFSYGWKLLIANIVYCSYADLRQLIIGKVYSSEDLAYYNKGYQFPQLIFDNTSNSLNSVLFPAMAERQDSKEQIKELTRKVNKLSSYIISPMMIGLAVVAEPFVLLLLGEKWLFAVPYMQVFCIMYGLSAGMGTANQNALKAIGKSNLLLIIEILKCAVDLAILFVSLNFGVFAIAIGMALGTFSRSFICAFPAKKYYNYPFFEQVIDMLPNLFINLVMGILVYKMSFIPLPSYLVLIIQVFSGIVIYLFLSAVTNNSSYAYTKTSALYFLTKSKEKAKKK